jgi:hypothetical protein
MTVKCKLKMDNASVVLAACKRRFLDVKHTGDTLRGKITKKWNSWFEVNLKTFEVKYDGDTKRTPELLDRAYRAEKIIREAEDEGRAWEESLNSEGDVVLEVAY